jgi:thiol-disulfide isomerase/thioredoxin
MGTWCSDSRREVPRMLKVLDIIGFPKENLSIINVDRNKKGIADEADDLNIELVPTFILYEDEKEIGRIIETPEETLEKDLVRIVE